MYSKKRKHLSNFAKFLNAIFYRKGNAFIKKKHASKLTKKISLLPFDTYKLY